MKKLTLIAVLLIGVILIFFLFTNRHVERPVAGVRPVQHKEIETKLAPRAGEIPAPPVDDPKLSGFMQYAVQKIPSLTSREKLILDKHYREFLARREQLELSLLTREATDQKTVLITIPAYFDRGLALYSELGDRILAELGRTRGAEIMTALESQIRAQNGQLGVAEQAILIEDRGDMVHIVHRKDGVISVNGLATATNGVFISDVMKSDPLIYSYLKSLFPGATQ